MKRKFFTGTVFCLIKKVQDLVGVLRVELSSVPATPYCTIDQRTNNSMVSLDSIGQVGYGAMGLTAFYGPAVSNDHGVAVMKAGM